MAKILIVEDNVNTSEAMRILLEKRDHTVATAANMRTALQLSEAENFDLLISDIKLGDGTVLELLKQLLERGPIKAIAVSGFITQEDQEGSFAAGFTKFLSKPFNFPELFEAVREVLGE